MSERTDVRWCQGVGIGEVEPTCTIWNFQKHAWNVWKISWNFIFLWLVLNSDHYHHHPYHLYCVLCRYKNRSVLAYHYYCWLIDPHSVYQHYKTWKRVVCDYVVGPLVIISFCFFFAAGEFIGRLLSRNGLWAVDVITLSTSYEKLFNVQKASLTEKMMNLALRYHNTEI